MASYGPQSVPFFFVGGRDILASILYDFEDGVESKLAETHGLGPVSNGWKESKAIGIRMASLSQRGLFDDATDGVHDALKNAQQTQQLVGYGLNGATYGNLFVGLEGAFGSKYVRQLSRENLHLANCEYTVKGQKDEGVILHPKTARAAAGNSDLNSVDNAASSANGGVGYLFVPTVTLGGYTSWTVKIRHSVDNATFVDLITFTIVTVAPVAVRATVAGTVNRYLATAWSLQGAGAAPSITPVVGFSRG